jgi:hypothetical protein
MAKTLAFHMDAFANPLPRPEIWSHADVYPNFTVWGWTVETDRTRPGFTSLENVSRTGFRSSVRDWLPSGKILRAVHVKITTEPLYRKNARVLVTIIRLHDNSIHRDHLFADPGGRLHFELDGDEYQVRIGSSLVQRSIGTRPIAPAYTTTDFQIADRRSFQVFRHAIDKQTETLGEGNGDGKANHGEQIVILLPDGGAFRAAELFSDSDCIDLTNRVSDSWEKYDWVGASAKYTVAKINCGPGRVINLKARVLIPNKPNHQIREAAIQLRILFPDF